jgi:bifunctional non-homologous end joining protein LigD
MGGRRTPKVVGANSAMAWAFVESAGKLWPVTLSPMLASWSTHVPEGPEWVFEPKWDGFRALVTIDDDLAVRVYSRTGRGWTEMFPELGGLGGAIGRSVVLDGEVVTLDGNGMPSYERLSDRMRTKRPEFAARRTPVTFVAFDVLQVDGEPLMDQPWWMRRDLLMGLGLGGNAAVPTLAFDDGDALLHATRSMGIEGVVGKRRGGRYVCGRRTSAWVKVKHPGSGWFDVVGWRPRSRGYPHGGLLIADEGRAAGTVVPGLDAEPKAVLDAFIERHGTAHGPSVSLPHGAQVRVHYAERTPRGMVREGIAHELRAALPGSDPNAGPGPGPGGATTSG